MKNKAMIDACLACFTICEYCALECIKMADKDHLKCISLCRDCAEICLLCARIGTRESEFSHHIMNLCADVCSACAEECDRFNGHEHCRDCAEACRACADECLKY